MTDKISKYNLKRTIAYNRLKETYDVGLEVAGDSSKKSIFLARVEGLDKLYEDFQTSHNQIVGLIAEEDFKSIETIRIAADKAYYGAKAIKHEILISESNLNNTINNSVPGVTPKLTAKLPKINLPIFDGNFKKWSGFIDLFNSLIHSNTELSNVEKFQYLLTSLEKEPLSLIKNLPVTENNYVVAYETMEKRYQNKRILATYHYNEISQFPVIQKGTSKELRNILNIFSENIAALRILQFPVDQWDFLLFNMLLQKLDSGSRTEFELKNISDFPTFLDLKYFLENKCKALESVQLSAPLSNQNFKVQNKYSNSTNTKTYQNKNSFPALMTSTNSSNTSNNLNNNSKCILCSSSHALYRCFSFISKTPQDRFSLVKNHNLCTNCLASPHSIRRCNSTSRCRVCGALHHTLLHMDKNSDTPAPLSNNKSNTSSPVSSNHNSSSQSPNVSPVSAMTSTLKRFIPPCQSIILLSTAIVEVKDIRGNYQKIRILFDTASMANFISEKCANRLGLPRQRSSIPIEGVNGMSAQCNNGTVHCVIKPCSQSNPLFSFNAMVLPNICSDQPKINVDPSQWSHIRDLQLADDSFYTPGPVDMLIGAELVPLVLRSGRISGQPGHPIALETIFGYILQGRASTQSDSLDSSTALLNCHVSLDDNLDIQLQKFWEVEQIPTAPSLSMEDKRCEEIYKTLTYRDESGRFYVPLPFRNSTPNLGDTYSRAYHFFCSLENRLAKHPGLRKAYCDFMQDYLENGHMSLVPRSDYKSSKAYYIPHHSIVKNEISGPKLRVVFNASFRGSNNISLNESLLVGPKLQRDISAILLSFRFYPFVFTCDIKQMYRQIRIQPQYQDFQRILWRFSPTDPVDEYHLLTVTYGVSSAPYLALRTLQELVNQDESRFPLAAAVIKRDIYVDDVVTGAKDLKSALQLQSELIKIMKSGGLELKKWASSHPAILTEIPAPDVQSSVSFDKEEPSFIKVLGLKWCPSSDIFSYSFNLIERQCNKRNILSEISRIFDPIGFISPVILLAKCILQKLWASKLSWDDVPPYEILQVWSQYKSELPQLAEIKIPRRVVTDNIKRIDLHGFCDSSQTGYASVIYFRTESDSGNVNTFLVTAKCKVAPLKTISLPRLELCGAVLLADLISFVKNTYSEYITFDSINAWSDSTIVLAWLAASPQKWKTFVANRVSQIQDIIPNSSWRYVPSSENPADCASRGLTPAQLLQHTLWWSGPSFLIESKGHWPSQPSTELSESVCVEEKHTVLNVSTKDNNFIDILLSKFSSLPKIQRIMSYILRFVLGKKTPDKGKTHIITPGEMQRSLRYIIRHVQYEMFSDVFDKIAKNMLLSKPLRKLAPFIDADGLLRVGGRLKHSDLIYETKHPILLPKSHQITDLIIEWIHSSNCHPGLKTLHYLILQQFWILSPRSSIYRCLSRCIRCFRCKPKSYNPYMADLPSLRISQIKPFASVCVDFAGPFILLTSRHRKAKTFKGYVCVFVCTSTKAIHLEVTTDLTSDAFIAAFKRFVARRGRCSFISSDQGTNFKGASRQLHELAEQAATELALTWNFNAPGSPHFNGLAEAGVKSMKSHLSRTIGSQTLTLEEFLTLLAQIESVLNSRPLCALSADPNDLQSLTPGHFLTLEPFCGIPEPDLTPLNINRLSRWQLIQRLHADFWKRWSHEYVHSLQERHKWTEPAPPIELNTLVLIKHDSKPPLQWELGRVIDLHPGKDEVIRVVTIKTAHGVLQRPVVKVCPLPGN